MVEPATEMRGIIHGLEELAYHSDEALSSTQVKWLLDCPARYRYNLDHPQPHKPAFDLGSAVHAKVLGTGWGIEELNFDDYRSKDAREARDAAYAAGLIPMLTKELVTVREMAESVLSNPDAAKILEGGSSEVSVFATDPETGIDMRCRFDRLRDDHAWAADLKTMAGHATVAGFSKAVADYKYDVSHAHYLDTFELVTGERPPMLFIAVEKEPPFFAAVFRLSNDEIEMGLVEARAARAKLRACREVDLWPGRGSGIQITQAPMRRIYDFTDRYGVAS
ncbi:MULTISPECIES: PD-(D/E)XK nuclease-like domain-containing protein [unclassified Microbacterium]|uniref:PD-(D/E)XK nuclease-like domain-containing protein n=1 Tax=unclassified Microbacterium TaxID=2609290 RepID=UPI003867AF74